MARTENGEEKERWVEVWKGEEPGIPGRKIEAAGIEMRIAAVGWGAHGGGIGVLSLFRKRGRARLLVREADVANARKALSTPPAPAAGPGDEARKDA